MAGQGRWPFRTAWFQPGRPAPLYKSFLWGDRDDAEVTAFTDWYFEAAAGGGTISGQTITATASIIAGSLQNDSTFAGQTITATASIIAGSLSGSSGATIDGQTITATASIIAGALQNDSTFAGQTITATASIIAGILFVPAAGGSVQRHRNIGFGLRIGL